MTEIKRKTKENIEDVERISDIINRKIKKSFRKLGAPSDRNKNPFLNPDGSLDLIENFPEYKTKKKKKFEVISYDHRKNYPIMPGFYRLYFIQSGQ